MDFIYISVLIKRTEGSLLLRSDIIYWAGIFGSLSIVGVGFVKIPPQFYNKDTFSDR